jgi:pyrimidine deaminase RibD-like protein
MAIEVERRFPVDEKIFKQIDEKLIKTTEYIDIVDSYYVFNLLKKYMVRARSAKQIYPKNEEKYSICAKKIFSPTQIGGPLPSEDSVSTFELNEISVKVDNFTNLKKIFELIKEEEFAIKGNRRFYQIPNYVTFPAIITTDYVENISHKHWIEIEIMLHESEQSRIDNAIMEICNIAEKAFKIPRNLVLSPSNFPTYPEIYFWEKWYQDNWVKKINFICKQFDFDSLQNYCDFFKRGESDNKKRGESDNAKIMEIHAIDQAIKQAEMCPNQKDNEPKVGAVIVKDDILISAYRSEKEFGEHAEYTVIKKAKEEYKISDLKGATLITTLEPCTTRYHNKKPCAQHIVDEGFRKVFVGMLDPNPKIRGKGILYLQQKGINVNFFSGEDAKKVLDINEHFLNRIITENYKIDVMKVEVREREEIRDGIFSVDNKFSISENLLNITSAKDYYKESQEIHKQYSRVTVLSKTPGLLLPYERDLTDFRKEYFKTIFERLREGAGSYSLTYLFDIKNYSSVLKGYDAKGEYNQIDEARQMLRNALQFPNLDLRYADTEPVISLVMGGDSIAVIGFREDLAKKLTEGIIVRSPELLRIFRYLFNSLKSEKVTDVNLVDKVLAGSLLS